MNEPSQKGEVLRVEVSRHLRRAEHSTEENSAPGRPCYHVTSCGFLTPYSHLCTFFSKYPVECAICFLPGLPRIQLCDRCRQEDSDAGSQKE